MIFFPKGEYDWEKLKKSPAFGKEENQKIFPKREYNWEDNAAAGFKFFFPKGEYNWEDNAAAGFKFLSKERIWLGR